MKSINFLAFTVFNCFFVFSQSEGQLSFGTDTTLEVITWNVEHFPKNGQTTINYVKQVVENIDADIYAFQEIDDTIMFKQLLSELPQYQYYFESSYYAGLAYIYKTDIIQINNIYEIYTTSPYWSPFPRSPKVLDITYADKNYIVINNHLKCCGDGTLNLNNTSDEETRRYIASNLLKEYIDTYLSNKRVIVVGDLNDEITDNEYDNVFINILTDSQNYQFADMDIALGNSLNWSYPSWPSHLDHILVTNELFADQQNVGSSTSVIKVDEFLPNGWYEYDSNISDHRPVGIKINPNSSLSVNNTLVSEIAFSNYPNPFSNTTTFNFGVLTENSVIEIIDCFGAKISSIFIEKGEKSATIHWSDNKTGIYFAKLISHGITQAVAKIISN